MIKEVVCIKEFSGAGLTSNGIKFYNADHPKKDDVCKVLEILRISPYKNLFYKLDGYGDDNLFNETYFTDIIDLNNEINEALSSVNPEERKRVREHFNADKFGRPRHFDCRPNYPIEE